MSAVLEEKRGAHAEQPEKINCECGSVVLKKNYTSHVKTKKHLAVVVGGPVKPSRSKGVNFADAQQTESADDYDDCEDHEDQEEEEEDEFEEEVLCILEGMDHSLETLNKKLDACFERIEETRSKVNLCLGECRDSRSETERVAMNQPYEKQINELTNAVNEMKTLLSTQQK